MTNHRQDAWKAILGLVSELKRCDKADITTASVAMAFICIDSLANLARPSDKPKATRRDFIDWVDAFLKAHLAQPYQYRGKDVYAARCAFLHNYGSEAELHNEDPDTIMFGFHNGGRHNYDPETHPRLVLIGTKSFINDVICGVDTFLKACRDNVELRQRVESRLANVFQMFPVPKSP